MEKTAGTTELEREGPVYEAAAGVVESTAFMPDYGFKNDEEGSVARMAAGTAVAGIVGSVITVLLAAGLGFLIHALLRRAALGKRPGAAKADSGA
jgi:cobalt/nickel transport system permease protein